jgi:hypothetical protein
MLSKRCSYLTTTAICLLVCSPRLRPPLLGCLDLLALLVWTPGFTACFTSRLQCLLHDLLALLVWTPDAGAPQR